MNYKMGRRFAVILILDAAQLATKSKKTAGGVCGRLYVADGQIVRKTIVKKV